MAVVVLFLLGNGACGDSPKPGAGSKLAADCQADSECAAPLTCTFRRCHEPCKGDTDCPSAERCVKGDPGDVCQLPDETICDANNACEGVQVCGVDAECRDACTSAAECVPGQICAKSNECASSDPAKDEVDGNGNIVPTG